MPEWDGWRIPLSGTWQLLKSSKEGVWVELIPVAAEKRFDFKVHKGGDGFSGAADGTKKGPDVAMPSVTNGRFPQKTRGKVNRAERNPCC